MELLAGQREKGESGRAVQACNDYLRLGPGRSLRLLLDEYRKSIEGVAPTQSIGTVNKWSTRYGWQRRAEIYDTSLEQDKNDKAEGIMRSGLALPHARVQKLKRLVRFLEQQIYAKDDDGRHFNVWLADVKQIGSGPAAERVDLERFNGAIIEQYRGALDDIAKETSGRRQTVDSTVTTKVTFDVEQWQHNRAKRLNDVVATPDITNKESE